LGLSIEGTLMEAIFVKRINRFVAEIKVANKLYYTHVPNTGRMKEFLIPEARIIVRRVEQENRKTCFDLVMAYEKDILINIDSKLPNLLLEDSLIKNQITPFNGYKNVSREISYGNSRFDFAVNNGKQMAFIEAKCVTYVESGTASFPDAPTERGRKHVFELIKAVKEGLRGAVFFIIQREDARSFTPNNIRDPLFEKAVYEGKKEGVEFYAINCIVTPSSIALNKMIPIII